MWIVLFWTSSKTGTWHANAVKDNELMKGLDHLTDVVSLEKKTFMGVLSICINTLCVGIKEERDKEFSLVDSEKSKGNQHKLKGKKLHLNLRKI